MTERQIQPPPVPPTLASGLASAYPWAPYAVPLVVFMLVGTLEPTSLEKPFELLGLSIPYSAYPWVYTAKIALTVIAAVFYWPTYRQFPMRVSPWAAATGVVGIVLWVGVSKLGLEVRLLEYVGKQDLGQRSAFNPFAAWPDQPGMAYLFLAIRLFGLAAVVPLIEEFFLRGLVMRYVVTADWWKVPIGTLTPLAAAVGTLLPVAMHPAEILAAAAWFSMITYLAYRTKNIWDCVVAHAVTNLLLGVYVVISGEWHFL